jgi:hypothetical protein
MLKKNTILFLGLLNLYMVAEEPQYPWLNSHSLILTSRVKDIPAPNGFRRLQLEEDSFGYWLQHLPLKEKSQKVKLYTGENKSNQSIHYRIINIDFGRKDLQQCADAIIRLRAEYLYSIKRFRKIHFNFTSGDTARYIDWMKGYRPMVNGNRVTWHKAQQISNSYTNFRSYLETVFIYSGSYSLKKELIQVDDLSKIQSGDIFIEGGFPGHAILVLDMAKSEQNDALAILLAQSYIPAQDIHILINEHLDEKNPWYLVGVGNRLYTPEWTFRWTDLHRFKE